MLQTTLKYENSEFKTILVLFKWCYYCMTTKQYDHLGPNLNNLQGEALNYQKESVQYTSKADKASPLGARGYRQILPPNANPDIL